MTLDFLELSKYFRDDEQREKVRTIIESRLADDRNPQECRYLMRFWWQLSMSYREVTREELEKLVSREKFLIISELLNEMEKGHEAIDLWIEKYLQLPIIEDKGFQIYER